MTHVTAQGLSLPPLAAADFDLTSGVHVVLGTSNDGTAELIASVSGVAAPRRGSVLIDGEAPHTSPKIRRRIGAVLAEEQLPPAAVVGQCLSLALRLRGDSQAIGSIAEAFGITAWLARRVTELDAAEKRTVALVIALSMNEPVLLAIHEPLSNLRAIERGDTRERLLALARAGACVICATSSSRDAFELCDSPLMLHGGRLSGGPALSAPDQWTPGLALQLIVQTPEPRRLAAALAESRVVSACSWDDGRWPGVLYVRGWDADALPLTVVRVARDGNIVISAISIATPSVETFQAAGSGWAKAAYDAAYSQAMTSIRAHSPSTQVAIHSAGGLPPALEEPAHPLPPIVPTARSGDEEPR